MVRIEDVTNVELRRGIKLDKVKSMVRSEFFGEEDFSISEHGGFVFVESARTGNKLGSLDLSRNEMIIYSEQYLPKAKRIGEMYEKAFSIGEFVIKTDYSGTR